MSYKYYNILLLAFSLVALSGSIVTEGESCSSVTDCACGEQCVDVTNFTDVTNLTLCHNSSCTCKQGCAVGIIFIPRGVNRPRTYCNFCRCPREQSDGIPLCTRVRWCNLTDTSSLYQVNPACQVQQQTVFKFEE